MNLNQFDHTLRTTGRLVLLTELARCALLLVAGALIVGLLAVLVDAMLALTPTGLLFVDVLIVLLLGAGVTLAFVYAVGQRFDRRRIARLIERRLNLTNSQIINAVEFSESRGDSTTTSAALRDVTLRKGVQLASSLSPGKLVDRTSLKRAAVVATFVASVALLAYAIAPGVFAAALPRYLDPWGEQPPFTLIDFEIEHPSEVHAGDPIVIRATLTGHNLPDRANVVFLDHAATESDSNATEVARRTQPMLRLSGTEQAADTRIASSPTNSSVNGDANNEIRDSVARPVADPNAKRFALSIDRAARTVRFYIDTPAGRSEVRTVTVLPVPRFEQVAVTYDPPAYTGFSKQIKPLGPQGIRALTGTQITLTVTSNVSLRAGRLRLRALDETSQTDRRANIDANELNVDSAENHTDDNSKPNRANNASIPDDARNREEVQLTLTPHENNPKLASVTFPLTHSAHFTLSLIAADEANTRSANQLEGSVVALKDQPPAVRIVEPWRKHSVVVEGHHVPLIVEAEDDVQVTGVTLFRAVNQFGPLPVPLSLDASNARIARARSKFDLRALAAKPGDTITFFATAYDNHPGSPQSADTEIYTIQVISLAEYQQQMRQRYRMDDIAAEVDAFEKSLAALQEKRAALEQELAALRDKIKQQGGEPTAEDMAKLDAIAQQLADYAEQQNELAERMQERATQPRVYDFEQAFADMLRQNANELSQQAQATDAIAGEYQQSRSQDPNDAADAARLIEEALAQLKRDGGAMAEAQQQQQDAGEDFDRIAEAEQMLAEAQRITSLIDRQRDLADRLAQFRESDELSPRDQLRAARLADEQQALKDQLDAATQGMADAAEKAADALPKMAGSAADIVESIERMNVSQDQADAERLARQGDGPAAHQAATRAAEKLESLLSESEGMAAMAEAEFKDTGFKLTRQQLGQSMQQLAQGRTMPQLAPTQSNTASGGQQSGFARSEYALYGPHRAGDDQQRNPRRGGEGEGDGTGATTNGQTDGGAERITPTTTTPRGHGASRITGVPTRWQDEAAAYARRLADDSR